MTSSDNPAYSAQANSQAYALLTITAMCWAANAILGRLAVNEVSPLTLVALRWIGTLLLVSVFAARPLRREWPVMSRYLPFFMVTGTLGLAYFTALFYVAAYTTTAVNIGILQGAMPIFVLVLSFAVFRTPVTLMQAAGVATTLLGVAVVATGGHLERLTELALNSGDLLIVLACALYAVYAVSLRKRPQVSSMALFGVLAGAACLSSIPLAAAEWAMGTGQWPTPKGWVIVSLTVLLPSVIAQICFIRGVQLIGPGRAGMFINLVPVFASIMAVGFLQEPFESFHAVALLLVLGGIWVAERGKSA